MSSDICALSRFLLVFFLCCNDRKKWAEITMYLIESQKKRMLSESLCITLISTHSANGVGRKVLGAIVSMDASVRGMSHSLWCQLPFQSCIPQINNHQYICVSVCFLQRQNM